MKIASVILRLSHRGAEFRAIHQRQLRNDPRFHSGSIGRGHRGRGGRDSRTPFPTMTANGHRRPGKVRVRQPSVQQLPHGRHRIRLPGYVQDVAVRSPVPLDVENQSATRQGVDHGECGGGWRPDRNRAHHPYRHRSRAVRQASAREPVLVAQFAGDAGLAGNRGRFQRSVSRTGRSRSNSFSLDGQPITDQQSKVFSNQIPLDAVQSMEVIEGAPPAEYGDKTSVVIVVTTRSGLGATAPHGDVTASYGIFGTTNGGFDFANGGKAWGNFISANGMDTGRFLDGPEFGRYARSRQRGEFVRPRRFQALPGRHGQPELRLHAFLVPDAEFVRRPERHRMVRTGGGQRRHRSQRPGGRLAGSAFPDPDVQHRAHLDASARTPTPYSRSAASLRQDQYNYYPSRDPFADLTPDLQLQTVGQNRTLTNLGLRASVSYAKGMHNLKIGVTYTDTILTEKDAFGIVDPTLNAPCLNPDGSPDTGASLTNPAGCSGMLHAESRLYSSARLLRPDADRHAARFRRLPQFHQRSLQLLWPRQHPGTGAVRPGHHHQGTWTFNLGLRFDYYNGIVTANQPEPRLGIAYNIKPTNTVLRISYARTLETPFNENLVLSSLGCNDPVINALMARPLARAYRPRR